MPFRALPAEVAAGSAHERASQRRLASQERPEAGAALRCLTGGGDGRARAGNGRPPTPCPGLRQHLAVVVAQGLAAISWVLALAIPPGLRLDGDTAKLGLLPLAALVVLALNLRLYRDGTSRKRRRIRILATGSARASGR